MGLISRVSSRTYRSKESNMLRLRHFVTSSKRFNVNTFQIFADKSINKPIEPLQTKEINPLETQLLKANLSPKDIAYLKINNLFSSELLKEMNRELCLDIDGLSVGSQMALWIFCQNLNKPKPEVKVTPKVIPKVEDIKMPPKKAKKLSKNEKIVAENMISILNSKKLAEINRSTTPKSNQKIKIINTTEMSEIDIIANDKTYKNCQHRWQANQKFIPFKSLNNKKVVGKNLFQIQRFQNGNFLCQDDFSIYERRWKDMKYDRKDGLLRPYKHSVITFENLRYYFNVTVIISNVSNNWDSDDIISYLEENYNFKKSPNLKKEKNIGNIGIQYSSPITQGHGDPNLWKDDFIKNPSNQIYDVDDFKVDYDSRTDPKHGNTIHSKRNRRFLSNKNLEVVKLIMNKAENKNENCEKIFSLQLHVELKTLENMVNNEDGLMIHELPVQNALVDHKNFELYR